MTNGPSEGGGRRRWHDLVQRAQRLPLATILKAALAVGAIALALIRLLAPNYSGERMDRTFLLLLAAAVLILLVPWERLTMFKYGSLELTLDRPQVSGALKALRLDRIENRKVRDELERRAEKLELLRGARVLWHDDVPAETVGLRRLMRALGVDVVSVTRYRRALVTLENDCDFDLLITDVLRWKNGYSPDGVKLVQEIRDHPNPTINDLPIVFYTWGETEEAAVGQLEEVSETFPRPLVTISPDTLLPTVIDLLEEARKRPIPVPAKKAAT